MHSSRLHKRRYTLTVLSPCGSCALQDVTLEPIWRAWFLHARAHMMHDDVGRSVQG